MTRRDPVRFAKIFAHSSRDLVAKISSSSPMSFPAFVARPRPVAKRSSVSQSGSRDSATERGQCRSLPGRRSRTAGRRPPRQLFMHGLGMASRCPIEMGWPRQQERVEVEAHGVGALAVQRRWTTN